MVYSLFTCARNWTDKGVYTILIFFLPRSGFVQQNGSAARRSCLLLFWIYRGWYRTGSNP